MSYPNTFNGMTVPSFPYQGMMTYNGTNSFEANQFLHDANRFTINAQRYALEANRMKLQQATDLLQRTMTGDQNLFSTFDPRTSTFSPTQTKRKRDQRPTSSQHFSQRTRTRNTIRKSPDERQLEMCMSQTIYDDIDENDTKVMANTLRDFYDLPPTNQTLASFKKLIRDQYDRNVNEDHINDVTNTLFTILKRVLAREDSLPRMLIDISAKLFGDSLVKVSKSTQVISQESQNSSFEVEEFDPHEENLKLTKTATIDTVVFTKSFQSEVNVLKSTQEILQN